MIDFKCPYCNRILRISEEHLGAEGSCRHCGGRILVHPPSPQSAADDWNGMLADVSPAESEKKMNHPPAESSPEKQESSVLARPEYLETNITILQTLLTQSRADVERLARELELARNARVEADVARDIAEARAKRMEERLVAETARTDFNILAADLERAITQLAQSRAEVDRLAKELELERSAKIRAEITGRLLESHLKRLQHDIDPNQDEFVNAITEVSDELLAAEGPKSVSIGDKSEPDEPILPFENVSPQEPLPIPEKSPFEQVAPSTLNLGKIRPKSHRIHPVFIVLLVVVLPVLGALAAITYLPQFKEVRDKLLTRIHSIASQPKPVLPFPESPQPTTATPTTQPQSQPEPSPNATSPSENITGIIRDAETGDPIGNVDLHVSGEASGTPSGIDLRSAQDGSFTLLGSHLGYGSLTIECPTPPEGYAPLIPYPLIRQKDQPIPTVEIKLTKAKNTAAAQNQVIISGKVLTAKGQPVPEASIWASINGENAQMVATANTEGTYEFPCVPGEIHLCATYSSILEGILTVLTPAPTEKMMTRDLTFPPTGRIIVKIKGQKGKFEGNVEACTLKTPKTLEASPKLMKIEGDSLVVPYLLPGTYDLGFVITGFRSVHKPNLVVPENAGDVEVEVTLEPEAKTKP